MPLHLRVLLRGRALKCHVISQDAVLRLDLQPPVIFCCSAVQVDLTVFSEDSSAVTVAQLAESERLENPCFLQRDIII